MGATIKNSEAELLCKGFGQLVKQADKVRRSFLGDKLELCSILNARSGRCNQDCKFCAQSAKHSTNIETYPLKTKKQMVEAARRAKQIGAKRFGIVTSGNRLSDSEVDVVAEAISEIQGQVGISVCCSLGALEKEQLEKLRDAGLCRYHHNIESSRRFYPEIVTTHSFDDRVRTIRAAKEAGLEVCSGGIIGMGEEWTDRVDMANTLKELDVDSVPINMLVPIKGTGLESVALISAEDAIRTICIFRIILEDKTIKIAAGREAVFGDNQLEGFMAGGNGMLIGGYLTVKGAELEADYALIEEIQKAWKE